MFVKNSTVIVKLLRIQSNLSHTSLRKHDTSLVFNIPIISGELFLSVPAVGLIFRVYFRVSKLLIINKHQSESTDDLKHTQSL